MLNLLEQYWQILLSVFILTALGYFYLMRIKAARKDQYYRITEWTYKRRHDWIKFMPLHYKIFFGAQVLVFLLFDWFLNVLLSVPMLDLPANFTELTTGRMKRYKKIVTSRGVTYGGFYNSDGSRYITVDNNTNLSTMDKVRYRAANWICTQLNRGEKGHC